MANPFKTGPDARRNTKGRPQGSPNRSTDDLRRLIQSFVDMNWDTIQTDFESLEPKDRLSFIERMFKHLLPSPLHELERLTDEQLDELILRLKNNQSTNN